MTPLIRLVELRDWIRGFRFHFNNEDELQEGIGKVLSEHFSVQREVRHGDKDRYDFVIDGNLVIEVKVGGSRSSVLRQLARYCEDEAVKGILLVTTRAAHRDLPDTFNGKPIVLLFLMENSF